MGRFEGRVALVTGAASGIGRATAAELAGAGATVVGLDLNLEGAKAAAADAFQLDVTKPSEAQDVCRLVAEKHGRIDVLVSCAGWDRASRFIETDEEFWDKVIAINLKGHMAMAKAVLPTMIEKGYGRIVTVASDAGRVGSSGEVVYSGAKGGVIAFTKGLAREVARYGITANCVAPGLTDTPLLGKLTEEAERLMTAIIKTIPLGRVGKPDEVAKAIAFFASDDAAYITGQTLSVNGGLSMV